MSSRLSSSVKIAAVSAASAATAAKSSWPFCRSSLSQVRVCLRCAELHRTGLGGLKSCSQLSRKRLSIVGWPTLIAAGGQTVNTMGSANKRQRRRRGRREHSRFSSKHHHKPTSFCPLSANGMFASTLESLVLSASPSRAVFQSDRREVGAKIGANIELDPSGSITAGGRQVAHKHTPNSDLQPVTTSKH